MAQPNFKCNREMTRTAKNFFTCGKLGLSTALEAGPSEAFPPVRKLAYLRAGIRKLARKLASSKPPQELFCGLAKRHETDLLAIGPLLLEGALYLLVFPLHFGRHGRPGFGERLLEMLARNLLNIELFT